MRVSAWPGFASGESPPPGSQVAIGLLRCPKVQEAGGISFIRTLIPSHLQKLHPLIQSLWGFTFQHANLGEHKHSGH